MIYVDRVVLKELFSKGQIDSGAIKKLKIASYTYQKTINDLYWIGAISKDKSKLSVTLLDNLISGALKKLYFAGFNVNLLSKKNINWFSNLTEPKTTIKLAELTNLSAAQTNQLLNKFSQFISKKGNRYFISASNPDLFDLLSLIKMKSMQNYTWKKGEEKLEKIPLGFQTKGALTGFSRFTEFGLMVNPSHKYVYFPKKELTLEEIFAHAVKFSNNANELTLCILFYLKNRAKAKISEIEKNCEKLGILETWFDIINYIDCQPVKNQAMFLPKQEFRQKAKLYEIETIPKYDQETIQKLFKEIEKELKETIQIYFIGGNALIEHKAKNSTKDIDIVLTSEKQAITLVSALKKIGFIEVAEKEFQYRLLETSAMLQRSGEPRIDLFVIKICDALRFSKKMQERSTKIMQGKAEIYLSALEDIFLLKSISTRDSDLIDCESILQKTTLNWKTIYDEIAAQEKNLKQNQEFTILDHLEALEKRMNIRIPITKKITSLCLEKSILYLAKKPISIQEIKQKIDFPESTIRNKIKQLEKEKKVKKLKQKPFKIIATKNKIT